MTYDWKRTYRDLDVGEIADRYIEGDPQVAQMAVHPDEDTGADTLERGGRIFGAGILKLLEVLFSSVRSLDEKKQILQEDFGITMTGNLEREVSDMCNLSDGVERRGIEKGILVCLRNLIDSMGWSVEQAMAALKIPEADRPQYASLLKG